MPLDGSGCVLLLLAFGFSLCIRLVSVAMLNDETIVPSLKKRMRGAMVVVVVVFLVHCRHRCS